MPPTLQSSPLLKGSYPGLVAKDYLGLREWYAAYLATYLVSGITRRFRPDRQTARLWARDCSGKPTGAPEERATGAGRATARSEGRPGTADLQRKARWRASDRPPKTKNPVILLAMPPDVVSLEVTTHCNLRCLNCFAHADGLGLGAMSLDLARNVVDEAARLGFTRLSLTGGEPLLWPHLFELLDFAGERGFDFVLINTNGSLLDEARCRRLAAYGAMLELSCSLNGAAAWHDQVRGRGSYGQAVAGITAALGQGLAVSLYTVVGRPVLEALPRLSAAWLAELAGAKAHFFIQLRGVADGYYQIDGQKLEPQDFIAMVRMAGMLALAGYPVQILENSLSSVVAGRLGLSWLPASPEITRAGKIVVLQDGAMAPNHSSGRRLGAYEPGALAACLDSAAYQAMTAPDSGVCPSCRFVDCCRSAGKLRPSSRFHNVGDAARPFCQKVLEVLP